MDSANAEAAHRDARQHALAQVCPLPTMHTNPLHLLALAYPSQHRQDSEVVSSDVGICQLAG